MLTLALGAAALFALGGLASLLVPRGRVAGERTFASLMVLGGALGLTAGVRALLAGGAEELAFGGLTAFFRLDPLSAAFLLPVCLVPALAAVYSTAYWSEAEHPRSARRQRAFLGLLAGAMAGVVLAGDFVVLLYAWEVMALAAYFLVVASDEDGEARRAGWIYFVATHVGTLALFALFALLRAETGARALAPLASAPATGVATAVLVLALVGFGLKAGLVPLHVWLPGAHASAPSHVSAVLSGVLLKVGVYGFVRVLWMMPVVPRWWSWVLLVLGGGTCLFGITLAVAQGDYKRLLAYSSIENVGVIFLALGLLALGLADGEPALAGIGLVAAVLHVWNHALFKPLLFLAAGAVLHATDTRAMSALGGVARRMPRVAALAALGCIAISALPPLNGFVSEWVLYAGLLRGVAGANGAAGAAPAAAAIVLALTGALALAAFVKLFGAVFLGEARSEATARARDPGWAMLAPMAVLAAGCLAIAVAPALALSLAARAALAWDGTSLALDAVRPAAIGLIGTGVLGAAALAALWLRKRSRPAGRERPGTWDCGFAAPSARMQYGESSLAQALLGLFTWVVVPRRATPRIEGPFPSATRLRIEVPDVVLDRGAIPFLRGAARAALRLRLLQKGRIQVYVLYILCALFGLLLVP